LTRSQKIQEKRRIKKMQSVLFNKQLLSCFSGRI
jgi:hypothetical protein